MEPKALEITSSSFLPGFTGLEMVVFGSSFIVLSLIHLSGNLMVYELGKVVDVLIS